MDTPSLRPWLLLPPEGSPADGQARLKGHLSTLTPLFLVQGTLLAPCGGWDPRVGRVATVAEVLRRVVLPEHQYGGVSPEGRRTFRDAAAHLFSAVIIPDDAGSEPPAEFRLTALQGETALIAKQAGVPVLLWCVNGPNVGYPLGDIFLSGSPDAQEGPPPYRAFLSS